MPKSRSIDIDDRYDFDIVKFFLKEEEMNYLNKFKLNKKIAFVLGGPGTIGSETCIALSQAGAKVINIDIVENKILKKIQT